MCVCVCGQANLALQEARLVVAQAELATAQEQLDAKQQELDTVQVTHSRILTFTISVILPTIKQKNFTANWDNLFRFIYRL